MHTKPDEMLRELILDNNHILELHGKLLEAHTGIHKNIIHRFAMQSSWSLFAINVRFLTAINNLATATLSPGSKPHVNVASGGSL